MAKVLGFGEIPLDVWESGGRRRSAAGGSTANTLCLLAGLGHETALLGAVGRDAAGRQCSEELAASGVDVSRVILRASGRTKQIRIAVEPGGERSFRIARGRMAGCAEFARTARPGGCLRRI